MIIKIKWSSIFFLSIWDALKNDLITAVTRFPDAAAKNSLLDPCMEMLAPGTVEDSEHTRSMTPPTFQPTLSPGILEFIWPKEEGLLSMK